MPESCQADELIVQLRKRIAAKKQTPFVLAIDGRCASGKTTLAAVLAKALNAQVIHMDDYFLQPRQRTQKRLEIPGENTDHERLEAQVLQPALQGKPMVVQRYDCSLQALEAPEQISVPGVLIIEGSYSMHPDLRHCYDTTVFLDIDELSQKQRLQHRESSDQYEMFLHRWIPLEEQYFQSLQPQRFADFLLHCEKTKMADSEE